MIHLLFLTSTAIPANPQWVIDLIKATPAPRTSEVVVPLTVQKESSRTSTQPAPTDYNPNLSPALRDHLREMEALSRRVIPLLERHQYEQAYHESERYCDAHFGVMSDSSDVIVPTMLFTGHYEEAETQMMAYVRRPEYAFDSNYLLLSVASSLRGHVAKGQGAYVVNSLRGALEEQGEQADAAWLPDRPLRPKDVVLASVLALGFRSAEPYASSYLEWALRLDPASTLAGTRLVRNYSWTKQYADAARVARSMVAHLPAGKDRDRFVETLKTVEGKKNEPRRTTRSGTEDGP